LRAAIVSKLLLAAYVTRPAKNMQQDPSVLLAERSIAACSGVRVHISVLRVETGRIGTRKTGRTKQV